MASVSRKGKGLRSLRRASANLCHLRLGIGDRHSIDDGRQLASHDIRSHGWPAIFRLSSPRRRWLRKKRGGSDDLPRSESMSNLMILLVEEVLDTEENLPALSCVLVEVGISRGRIVAVNLVE